MKVFSLSVLLLVLFITNNVYSEEIMIWENCVKEAKENNPDLFSAEEQWNQSKATKDIVRSNLFPQIIGDFDANASKATGGSNSNFDSNGQVNSYSYGVTGQQLLFDGLKTSYDISSANEGIKASWYNYEVTSSNVRLSLRAAFINLLSAQEDLKVSEDIALRRQQNLDLVKLRYEGGREHLGSFMTSQADLAQALFNVEQAKRNITLAQGQLVKELGRIVKNADLVAKGDFEVIEKDRERPDFENIADTNPLLQQLIAQKEAARYGVKSAYSDFWPQVFANASAAKMDTHFPPNGSDWSFGVSATLPIFEGGLRVANVSKAKAVLGQALADERSGRDGVIYTLENTWTILQNTIDFVEVQKKFLNASGERAKIAEAQYSNGLLSFDNWTIIEDDLVTAKQRYLDAQTAALLAEANWIQAKGGTLDYD